MEEVLEGKQDRFDKHCNCCGCSRLCRVGYWFLCGGSGELFLVER